MMIPLLHQQIKLDKAIFSNPLESPESLYNMHATSLDCGGEADHTVSQFCRRAHGHASACSSRDLSEAIEGPCHYPCRLYQGDKS